MGRILVWIRRILAWIFANRAEIAEAVEEAKGLVGVDPFDELFHGSPKFMVCDECVRMDWPTHTCKAGKMIAGTGPHAWTFFVADCPVHGRNRPWIADKWKEWEEKDGGAGKDTD